MIVLGSGCVYVCVFPSKKLIDHFSFCALMSTGIRTTPYRTTPHRIAQGFFGPRVPVDNLDGGTVGVSYFGDMDLEQPVVVSPDAGGVYR